MYEELCIAQASKMNCYDVDLFRSHTSVYEVRRYRKIDIRQNNNFLPYNAVDIFYVNSIWMVYQPNADILLLFYAPSFGCFNEKKKKENEENFGFVVLLCGMWFAVYG